MRKYKINMLLCAAILSAAMLGGCGQSDNTLSGSLTSKVSEVQQSGNSEEISEPESSAQESSDESVPESSTEESSTVSDEEGKKEQSESKPESKDESKVSQVSEKTSEPVSSVSTAPDNKPQQSEVQKPQTQTITITETTIPAEQTVPQTQQQTSVTPAPVETSKEYSIDDVMSQFARSYMFASGVGGWATTLNVNSDGSFNGAYHAYRYAPPSEPSTEVLSEFTGSFYSLKKINDYTYEADISDMTYKNTPGTTGSAGQKIVEYIDAYGLSKAKTIRFYLPDTPVSEIPEDGHFWLHISDSRSTLGFYCIYNVDEDMAFISNDR